MDEPQDTPPPLPSPAPRAIQPAVAIVLVLFLGLLALRGYGNGLTAKPTEPAGTVHTDLNRAGRAELEQVPGVGPALARTIDDHRRERGPFGSVEELRQVRGVGPATFDRVHHFFRVDAAATQASPQSLEPLVLERRPVPAPRAPTTGKLKPGDPPVDVNAAGIDQLLTIPGVGPVTAQNILAARGERPFTSVNDLDRVKGIGPKTLEKIRPFVFVK